MLGHIGINVPDLGIARSYYGDLLPLVGFEPFVDDNHQFAFVPRTARGARFLPATGARVLVPDVVPGG